MKREPRLTKRQRKALRRWQTFVADRKARYEEARERAERVAADDLAIAQAFERFHRQMEAE